MWDGNKKNQDGRFEGESERESNEKDNLRKGPRMGLARNRFQGNFQKATIMTPAKTPRYNEGVPQQAFSCKHWFKLF